MAEIAGFDVVLDEREKVYCPGESVHGTVKLKVTKDLKLKELRLECVGEAEVTWPAWSGTYTKYCYNRQTYLELSTVLFPIKDSTDPAFESLKPVEINGFQVLPRGDYSFTFYMVIPSDENLPPSLEEKYGHIRYWFRGIIKRGRGRSDIKTSDVALKIGDVSLEDFEEEMNPIELHQRKEVGLPCCVAGGLELSLKTNKGAYHPGDVIHFSLAMENNTSRDAATVQVVLTKRTVYISNEDTKFSNSEEIEQISIGRVKSRDQISYGDVCLTIPEAVQPTVYNSECIALLYYLQVNVKFDGKAKNGNQSFVHVPIVSACAKTNPVTNSRYRSDKAFYASESKRDRKGSLFWVTGTPHGDRLRSQLKNLQRVETQPKNAEANVSDKPDGKAVNKASKLEIKLKPFSLQKEVFYLSAVPPATQQLQLSYKFSEYL